MSIFVNAVNTSFFDRKTGHIAVCFFVFMLICLHVKFKSSFAYATPVEAGHSSVELVSENGFVKIGEKNSFGLRIKPQTGWHSYWVNSGDAGKSISVVWDNPNEVVVGPIQLPAPHIIPFMGLVSYGYNEDILGVFDLEIPPDMRDGEVLRLQGSANWLVCDDKLCVPQNADISIAVTVGVLGRGEDLTHEFSVARAKIPTQVNWPAQYGPYRGDVLFHIQIPPNIADSGHLELFPVAPKIVDHATVKQVNVNKDGVAFFANTGARLNRNPVSDLVIVVKKQGGFRQAYIMAASKADLSALTVTARADPLRDKLKLEKPRSKTMTTRLFGAITFAFLGGLLLNLMPCVLPILSLKALGLVSLSSENLKTARINGLVYTVGVLVSFLLFAFVLMGFRSAGSYAGWGFQMQHPAVLVVLILFIGAIGANLAGLFEFTARFSNIGQNITHGDGYEVEFFTGVLAVVVASPCTAPFMGVALGYALTQSLLTAILVFLGLGVGFALPYLLLCCFPVLRSWIPKPGAWMHSFKQLLAFPMFATAIWLLWVLGHQVGLQYVLRVLVLSLLLSMAVWVMGKASHSPKKTVWNVFALVILGGAVWTGFSLSALRETRQVTTERNILTAEIYSLARLENLLANNQPVFVYFTADWCITCKVNEKAALYKPEVAAAFADKNIHVLVGDWTNPDDEIAKILKRFDRVGVPLYLYYAPGTALGDAKILPQILTTKTIIGAL